MSSRPTWFTATSTIKQNYRDTLIVSKLTWRWQSTVLETLGELGKNESGTGQDGSGRVLVAKRNDLSLVPTTRIRRMLTPEKIL